MSRGDREGKVYRRVVCVSVLEMKKSRKGPDVVKIVANGEVIVGQWCIVELRSQANLYTREIV